LWSAEPGVVGRLGECADGWCRFEVTGREGWVRAERLWGAGAP
jgi:SH3-like domain-containing protein